MFETITSIIISATLSATSALVAAEAPEVDNAPVYIPAYITEVSYTETDEGYGYYTTWAILSDGTLACLADDADEDWKASEPWLFTPDTTVYLIPSDAPMYTWDIIPES